MAKSPWYLKADSSGASRVGDWRVTIHPLFILWVRVLHGFGLLRRAA